LLVNIIPPPGVPGHFIQVLHGQKLPAGTLFVFPGRAPRRSDAIGSRIVSGSQLLWWADPQAIAAANRTHIHAEV